MKSSFKSYLVPFRNEILTNKLIYFLLLLVLVVGLFVRVYRTEDLLRFYYDQGRDALVIWRLWQDGKLFLIGPVTGLAGIFLGPFYYYLITPFYVLGGGNPSLPEIFLAAVSIIAIFFLYIVGARFHSRTAGLIAATIASFSYYIILASRWLANPTAMLLTSVLLLWSMLEISKGSSKKWWIVVALLIGLSLQLEAANAVFFVPMILIFAIWQRKSLPNKKIIVIAIAVFLMTLLPQIVFNFRHGNILFNNFRKILIEEKSFRISFWQVLPRRLNFFWSVFHSKINPGWRTFSAIFFTVSGAAIFISAFKKTSGFQPGDELNADLSSSFRGNPALTPKAYSLHCKSGEDVIKRRKLSKNHFLPILILFILTPVLGLLVFQGNYGNIYDYYMTGVYLPFVLLFSIGLAEVWKIRGWLVVLIFFLIFLFENGVLTRNYLIAGVDGPTHISLGNQLQAVNWVFEDAKERREFNVDIYVPPVIPHSYDYLFLWQATKRCGKNLCGMREDEQLPLLYTLYEVDPPHPERLEAWLARQKGIGKVEEEKSFGGITVQRRKRI